MTLLLTVVSVLALWVFLILLVVGLLLIFKALQSVRTGLEKIAMGVRAIEQETSPLGPRAVALGGALGRTANGMMETARRMQVRR